MRKLRRLPAQSQPECTCQAALDGFTAHFCRALQGEALRDTLLCHEQGALRHVNVGRHAVRVLPLEGVKLLHCSNAGVSRPRTLGLAWAVNTEHAAPTALGVDV